MQNLSFTLAGATEATGIAYVALKDAIRAKDLPAIRSGRRYIILADDLRAWLEKSKARGVIPSPIDDEGRERLAELNRQRKRSTVTA